MQADTQAFPSFELMLTDPGDQPLASHTIDPGAYLGKMSIRLEPLQRIISSTEDFVSIVEL